MKVKVSFNTPSNGHTAILTMEITCGKSPMFMPGNNWINILPIDSHKIIEEESTPDYKEAFVLEPLYNKFQLVVRPTNPSNLFFMNCTEKIEE